MGTGGLGGIGDVADETVKVAIEYFWFAERLEHRSRRITMQIVPDGNVGGMLKIIVLIDVRRNGTMIPETNTATVNLPFDLASSLTKAVTTAPGGPIFGVMNKMLIDEERQ